MVATNALVNMLRLRQLAAAYGEVTSTADWSGLSMDDPAKLMNAVDSSVHLSEPSTKLDAMEEVLTELGDRQAVIFAESKQLIMLAAGRLEEGTFGLLTGDVKSEDRTKNLQDFRDGKIRYMLVVIQAGGEGVDGLQAADTAIFLQRPWSHVQNVQAEDRLHRIGQEGENVTYVDIVATDTVEEKVFEALEKKKEISRNVVQDA